MWLGILQRTDGTPVEPSRSRRGGCPHPPGRGRPGLRVHVRRFRVSPLVNQAPLFLPLNYVYSAETLFTAAARHRRARRLAGLGVVAPRISEWSKVRLTPPWIHHAPHRPRIEIRRF